MFYRSVFLLCLCALFFSQKGLADQHDVRLRLKWWHQFQFAGYYAAVKQGYYKAEGLSVKLIPGDAIHPVTEEVLSGRADFGITGSDLLIDYSKGKPVKALAAIFQHSPYVIMSMPGMGIRVPSDLVGKSIMASENQGWVELKAIFLKEGIDLSRLAVLQHSWENLDLVNGKVDAMTGYSSVEPYQIKRMGGLSPVLIKPINYGVDFYGDILFSSEKFIENNPETVEKFRRASCLGWEYAMSHKEEMCNYILTLPGVAARKVTKEALLFEANEMDKLILPELVEMGHMNEGRWSHILDIHKALGLMPATTQLDGFIYKKKPGLYESIKNIGFFVLGIVMILFAATLIYGIMVRRAVKIKTRQQQEAMEALAVSEERYRTLVEQASDGIVICDPELRFIQVNSAALQLLGYSREALTDLRLTDILVISADEPALQTKDVRRQQVLLTTRKARRKDGSFFMAEINSSILSNGNYLGFVRDVTQRWEADEALEKKEKQLAAERNLLRILVDSIPDYVYVKDRETRHILNNKKMLQLLGAGTEEETLHKTLAEFFPADEAEIYLKDDREVIASGKPVIDKQEPLYLASGELRWLNTTKIPIFDNGQVQGVVGISRDITESVENQREKELIMQINAFFSMEESIKVCLEKMLALCCTYFEQQAGEVWLTGIDQEQIYLEATYFTNGLTPDLRKQIVFRQGEGLPGLCCAKKETVFIPDLQNDELFLRKEWAAANQFLMATAIPVIFKGTVTAVLIFYNRQDPQHQSQRVSMGDSVRSQLAVEIQRKKTEHELNRYFTQSPDLLCIVGSDGFFKKVNPAFTHLLGFSETELTTNPYLHFVHPDDANATVVSHKDAFNDSFTYTFENRYRTKAGEWKWISWSSSEVLDENGLLYGYGRDITEKKQLEENLDKVHHLARIGGWNLDLVNNKMTLSRITNEILETTPDFEPTIEESILFYKEGESRKKILALLQKSMKDGSSFSEELQVITAKGNEKWIRVIGEAELKEGRCVRLYGGFQDIDELKRAQLSFVNTLKERNTILESIGDAFFAIDKNWVISYWNKEASKVLGVSAAEIVGKNLLEYFGDNLSPNINEYYQTVVCEKKPIHYERYLSFVEKWFEISAFPSENGASVYLKDISERKKTQEAIRISNERYDYVAKATNDSIWDWDLLTNKVIRSGENYTKLFGYDSAVADADNQFWALHVYPDDLKRVESERQKILADPTVDYWEDEYRFQKADGAYAFVFDKGHIIRNEQGVAIRMIGSTTDITERKKQEESLKQLNANLERINNELAISNQELEQFAYVSSHDLQEPLRMVTGFLTQLEKRYANQLDEKARQYIAFAVDGAKRMRRIILELLEFSRVGRVNSQKENIDLNILVNEVCLLQKKVIEEKGAVIRIPKLPVIYQLKSPVLQVFQNLISNAIKYSRKGVPPLIELTAAESDDHWTFSVRDNGIGIEEEYFEKIFVIFQRLHAKDEYSGTGIGLAIVKKIIDSMGGRIWVSSEPGKGSVFTFTIPK
jgi:PAS domain S-box-containing protein